MLTQTLVNRLIVAGIALIVILGGVLAYQKRVSEKPVAPSLDPQADAPVIVRPETPVGAPTLSTEEGSHEAVIIDLFSPSDARVAEQITRSQWTAEAEKIMATSFVLNQCGLINDEQYQENFHALTQFVLQKKLAKTRSQAADKVRSLGREVGAQYQLLYSKTDCKSERLRAVAQQMLAWQSQYRDDSEK
jgi:hypothetical protein